MIVQPICIFEKDLIDPETEAHYAFIKSIKNTTGVHCHDFYEIFLITRGQVVHNVNSSNQLLVQGSLVFVRPSDTHYYEKSGMDDCELINLAFPQRTVNALFDYLGEGFSPRRLLNGEHSPVMQLSDAEASIAKGKLERLNTIPAASKAELRTELRILLLDLLTGYFSKRSIQTEDTAPSWLRVLLNQMQQKENFIDGVPKLLKLSGKSHEHLCRTFMDSLGRTPTDFVNELRINYAANLIKHTNESIVHIAMETGFENLSHFYHLFKRVHHTSPAKYRKENRKTSIPL